MSDDPSTMSFRISTENLSHAIGILRVLGGLDVYLEIYQALVVERSRRQLRMHPQEIPLARE